ncbi:hypothetical protein F4811DRAFT_514177 [Daldinia bambusicola]|nr:hypothetical protein F4811DRAFT_514177 [Daldinia bambusicola]
MSSTSELSGSSGWSRSDHDSDTESVSSSVMYADEEPFVTFQGRVLNFALHKIWPDATEEEITVERMAGGAENRIICMSRQPTEQPSTNIQYIIRMPRFDTTHLDSQVATLQFLHQHSKIHAPDVISFDDTEDNELNVKYIIQTRIPGGSLLFSYPHLTHEERCRLACELGHVYSKVLSTRSDRSGVLMLPIDRAGPLEILPWRRPDVPCTREYRNSLVAEDIKKILQDIFTAQKDYDLRMWPTDTAGPAVMDQFYTMAEELEADGWFTSCYTSLAHLDLEPRNILVNPTSDTSAPIISAILDWDSAVFAPQFMCCKPPLWLWGWQDDDEEDERTANDEPPTPEGRQLKQLFEEAAGPDYARFAYEPAYRLARRLVRFAIEGICSNMAFEEANEMLEEWAAIHHGKPKVPSITEQIKDYPMQDETCIIGGESSLEKTAELDENIHTGRCESVVGARNEGVTFEEDESTLVVEENNITRLYEKVIPEKVEEPTSEQEVNIGDVKKRKSIVSRLKKRASTRARFCVIL